MLAEPAPIQAPDSALHRGDPPHVSVGGDPAQHDTVGQGRRPGQLRGEPDQNRVSLPRNESRGAQACGEVGRLVVRVGRPPDGLTARGEVVPLPGDQPVEFCAGYSHVARAADVPAVPAGHPQQRPVPLIPHPSARLGLYCSSHVLVIGGEQGSDGRHWVTLGAMELVSARAGYGPRSAPAVCQYRTIAQTILPPNGCGWAPHRALSVATISRPRPLSASRSCGCCCGSCGLASQICTST